MRGNQCHYCNNMLGKNATTDHIVPISRGGEDSNWNKVPACERCNTRKADSWPTCKCSFCQNSVERHAAMGTTEDGPRDGWLSLAQKKRQSKNIRNSRKRHARAARKAAAATEQVALVHEGTNTLIAEAHDWTPDIVEAIAADYNATGSLAELDVSNWAQEVARQINAGEFVNTVQGEGQEMQ